MKFQVKRKLSTSVLISFQYDLSLLKRLAGSNIIMYFLSFYIVQTRKQK